MSLEQKRQHWFDADDNEYYASELRTSAAVYIAALEKELAALKADWDYVWERLPTKWANQMTALRKVRAEEGSRE